MGEFIRYFGVTQRVPNRDAYRVWFPDFPDLETHTRTLRDVERAAARLIHEEIYARRGNGLELPDPRPREHFEGSPDYRSALLLSVDADATTGRVEVPTDSKR